MLAHIVDAVGAVGHEDALMVFLLYRRGGIVALVALALAGTRIRYQLDLYGKEPVEAGDAWHGERSRIGAALTCLQRLSAVAMGTH